MLFPVYLHLPLLCSELEPVVGRGLEPAWPLQGRQEVFPLVDKLAGWGLSDSHSSGLQQEAEAYLVKEALCLKWGSCLQTKKNKTQISMKKHFFFF